MAERNYTVYKIINKINKKIYYGMTGDPLAVRFHSGHGYARNSSFHADIQHYGWAIFRHEIIAENLTVDEAERIEKTYITLELLHNKAGCYNKKRGGYSRYTKGCQVRCVETGEVFKSEKAAAMAYGIDRGNLCRAIKGIQHTCGGYHWEVIDAGGAE